jgi:hypothetical protein
MPRNDPSAPKTASEKRSITWQSSSFTARLRDRHLADHSDRRRHQHRYSAVAQYPQISPPTVEVEINYPGANAETVEQSIATNVEAEVNGAENMIYMSSKSSSDGRYVLTCTFKVGANLDLANVDINNRVNKATAKLPQEAIAYGISVKKKSPDILLAISIYSPDNLTTIHSCPTTPRSTWLIRSRESRVSARR